MKAFADSDLFRALVEQAPDAVIFADRDGLVRAWNAASESLFGHTAEEILGKSLDIIIPEDLRRRHGAGFNRAIAEGHTRLGNRPLPTRALHKDGSRLYVALSFAVITDSSGAAVGAMAAGRDITGQYLADKAVRKRLAELEERQRYLSGPTR